ncbi:MAG: hypothetical protein AAGN35_00450 [Bacteroidota bacterium]
MNHELSDLQRAYQENRFQDILSHPSGIYFLKLRSLSRAAILRRLADYAAVKIEGMNASEVLDALYTTKLDEGLVDRFIATLYAEERAMRKGSEADLYDQLYRLDHFDWGGFYQNNVEQTLVNQYVKKITDYTSLVDRVEHEIAGKIKGYMLCSWYNHWSSILIEDMIKDQSGILPAIGRVKKVDFFWHDFPFDLKVTYFPDGYLQRKRGDLGLPDELSELKNVAKELEISFDKRAAKKEQFKELFRKIEEHVADQSGQFIEQLFAVRRQIIKETIDSPQELMRWFYENQGIRRFDAANRFFIVLIDWVRIEDSWKLKRNRPLLERSVGNYFRQHQTMDFSELAIEFDWQGKQYRTYATSLFIVHNRPV